MRGLKVLLCVVFALLYGHTAYWKADANLTSAGEHTSTAAFSRYTSIYFSKRYEQWEGYSWDASSAIHDLALLSNNPESIKFLSTDGIHEFFVPETEVYLGLTNTALSAAIHSSILKSSIALNKFAAGHTIETSGKDYPFHSVDLALNGFSSTSATRREVSILTSLDSSPPSFLTTLHPPTGEHGGKYPLWPVGGPGALGAPVSSPLLTKECGYAKQQTQGYSG
jgi:hypothetical protein